MAAVRRKASTERERRVRYQVATGLAGPNREIDSLLELVERQLNKVIGHVCTSPYASRHSRICVQVFKHACGDMLTGSGVRVFTRSRVHLSMCSWLMHPSIHIGIFMLSCINVAFHAPMYACMHQIFELWHRINFTHA